MLSAEYLAGVFDMRGNWEICQRRGYPIAVSLQISLCDRQFLEELRARFGGTITANRRSRSYRWKVGSRRAVEFLALIYAHLRLRREEAAAAFLFQRSVDLHPGTRWRPVPEGLVAYRRLLAARLRDARKLHPLRIKKTMAAEA